jgi:hypothetical protein
MLIARKNKRNLRGSKKFKKLRGNERDLRLQQMKEAMKRLISNKLSQDRSIRLKDAANRSATKTLESNERK